jgi:hypothetical protein
MIGYRGARRTLVPVGLGQSELVQSTMERANVLALSWLKDSCTLQWAPTRTNFYNPTMYPSLEMLHLGFHGKDRPGVVLPALFYSKLIKSRKFNLSLRYILSRLLYKLVLRGNGANAVGSH